MERFFPEDSYDTPENVEVHCSAGFAPLRTLHFYWKIFQITRNSSRLARKGEYTEEAWAEKGYETIVAAERCGAKVHISGLEKFRNTSGPVVFIGNHMSVFETYAMSGIVAPDKHPAFVIKRELLKLPLFGAVMGSLRHVAVGRKNPRDDFRAVIDEGRRLIEQDVSMIIFPQSTRTVEFIPEKFNTIGVKLARTAGVTIIPFALKTDFWGLGKFIKDFGPVGRAGNIHVQFGDPIKVSGNGKDEHQKIIAFIQGKLDEWRPLS